MKYNYPLDKIFNLYYNTIRNRAERSRDMLPKGVIARKVRASQGRVADNVSRRRLPGKCNRNKPPLVNKLLAVCY